MLMPEDRAESCALSLAEIEKRLQPEQRKALRVIWRSIKKSKLPARSYLDTIALFEQMLIDAARVLFELSRRDPDYLDDRDAAAIRVAQRYGAIAWLEEKCRREGVERK